MKNDLKFIIDVVKQASLLINDEFEVKAKDDKGDLVTNFDYEIEKFIINKIKENYDGFSIISEEFNSKAEKTDNYFTIDPIDGTINFANGIPLWGIQVACVRNQKTCAAVIYLPKLNELYYADEDGAFLNDNPISVNKFSSDRGIYTIEGPGKFFIKEGIQKINRNSRNFWSSAVCFSWVACGRLSAVNYAWDCMWDYVPGMYIVEKAGGSIYNDEKIHIAANSEEFVNALKEASSTYINKTN